MNVFTKQQMDDNGEKLRRVKDEIAAILQREDIAGFIVLHAPGALEIYQDLQPSYSILKTIRFPNGDVAYHIHSKLQEHFGGDKEKQIFANGSTANMVSGMALALADNSKAMAYLAKTVDKATGAEHTGLQRPKHKNG